MNAPLRAVVFLGSFLLFQVELIVGRMLLPSFGSSASVWTTCLVFFQGTLLLGYLYAAKVGPLVARGRYRWAHVGLVLAGAAVFPFRLVLVDGPPALAVTFALVCSVGLPFAVLSTTSVVAQGWMAASAHPRAKDPYFLYGTSNAGALAALVTYPLLVEPAAALPHQLIAWYAGYLLFAALCALCVPRRADGPSLQARHDPGAGAMVAPGPAAGAPRAAWLLLPLGANALLMASTSALTLDASVPLVWTVPLTIYLLTLVICFAPNPPSPRSVDLLCLGGLLLALGALGLVQAQRALQAAYLVLHGAVLFVGCMLAHAHLVRLKPGNVTDLGRFYLSISAGGFAGALLLGLVAPVAFRRLPYAYLDYVVAGALLLGAFLVRDRARLAGLARARPALVRGLGVGLAGLLLLAGAAVTLPGPSTRVDGSRTFYGLYSVKDQGGLRYFHHGNTVHGTEALLDLGTPRAYFGQQSPIAGLLGGQLGPRVAVVGLGAGSLAAYGRAGQRFDFFEIDPEVERIARAHFSFLRSSKAQVEVVTGDARLTLAKVPDGTYDALVIDAFSSDFIPTHLVTVEAFELYLRKVKPGGWVACHVSNRIFDLRPVLARIAQALSAHGATAASAPDEVARAQGLYESEWFLLSADAAPRDAVVQTLGWTPAQADPELSARRPWTDAYVNLFHALGRQAPTGL